MERLTRTHEYAAQNLDHAQKKIKHHFVKKSVVHEFALGERALVLLPIAGSTLTVHFSGPYIVEKKLTDTTYVIVTKGTPYHCLKKCVCHINMLKAFVDGSTSHKVSPPSNPNPNPLTLTCSRSTQRCLSKFRYC